MNDIEKCRFIAENLAEVVSKHSKQFKEKNEKLVEDIINKGDSKDYTKVMSQAVIELARVMKEWEKISLIELENLSPEQYFAQIKTIDQAILIISVLIEKNKAILPPSLQENVHKLGEDLSDEILNKIDSIFLGSDGKLTIKQQAELKIVEIMALEKFAYPLARLLFRIDIDNQDEDTIECIMDAFKEIGVSSIPCLIAACEKSSHKGNIYVHSIITLGDIASKHKSEEIYRYLKECFRKSEEKIIEANAISLYNDGRAVAVIRSYVDRNISSMNETEYSAYRDIILRLGGIIADLDSEYGASHKS